MSVSTAANAVREVERDLGRLRKRHAEDVKKVAKLEGEITKLSQKAEKASSDGMRRNYLNQLRTKQGQLDRARGEVAKRTSEVTKGESKLAEANRKLREAERKERERNERKEQQDRRREEQRRKQEKRRRERKERAAARQRAAVEAQQSREIDVLRHRTSELEERLAAAEREAAPPEITVLFLASSPEDQSPLRIDKETREIQKRIRSSEFRDSIWFEWRPARQLPDLLQDLNEVRPTVLHFSGHSDDQALAFEEENGETRELDTDQLVRLLEAGGDQIRVIVFNSCDSAAQAENRRPARRSGHRHGIADRRRVRQGLRCAVLQLTRVRPVRRQRVPPGREALTPGSQP